MSFVKGIFAAVFCVASMMVAADEYFVDCNWPDNAGDGKSVATAKRTIQVAVGVAADGETTLRFKNPAATNHLVFDYSACGTTGDAELGAISRRVLGFAINFR